MQIKHLVLSVTRLLLKLENQYVMKQTIGKMKKHLYFRFKTYLFKIGIEVKKENRIIPIIRFHSIYELCPENIDVLEELFGKNE